MYYKHHDGADVRVRWAQSEQAVTDQNTVRTTRLTRFQTKIVLSESHHRPKHWRQLPVTPRQVLQVPKP